MSPHRRPLASCLAAAFCLASPLAHAANRTVVNCNDSGSGSLRAAIAAAASGDTVVFDTAAMACTTISVTAGQLEVGVQTLTLQGPMSPTLTISAGTGSSRVIHDGVSVGMADTSRKLTINNLTIADGHRTVTVPAGGFIVEGGCIDADGDVTLSNSTVTGCSVTSNGGNAQGGGIASYSLHAYNSRIINNVAYASPPTPNNGNTYFAIGGGASVRGGALVVKTTTVSNNIVEAGGTPTRTIGGGLSILSEGPKTISASTISGNSADRGGGLYAYFSRYTAGEPLIIESTTIAGNHANKLGGGAFVFSLYAPEQISNSTISGNDSSGTMAGLFAGAASNELTGNTIVLNTSAKGTATYDNNVYAEAAGLYIAGAATLRNTIVANNVATDTGASDLNKTSSSTIDGSHNLIRATLAGTTAPADTLTTDPLLGALADNGGPTLTHALLAGSPAIDAGCAASGFPNDQRGSGYPRVWGIAPDIGAYETGDPASGDIIFRGGFDAPACAP